MAQSAAHKHDSTRRATYRAKHGELPARRQLISGVLGIRNAQEAAALLEMAEEDQ